MIFEICRELDAYLKAHQCPVDVVYGPETTKPTAWGRERVVVENDFGGSDKFPGARSQRLNPPLTTVRVQALKATIYARSPLPGGQPFEHRRRADLILDQVLCAIRSVACIRKNGYDYAGGSFVVPDDMAESDVHGGAAYELKFTLERGVTEANFKGEISPEAPKGPGNRLFSSATKVSEPGTVGPGPNDTACGA